MTEKTIVSVYPISHDINYYFDGDELPEDLRSTLYDYCLEHGYTYGTMNDGDFTGVINLKSKILDDNGNDAVEVLKSLLPDEFLELDIDKIGIEFNS